MVSNEQTPRASGGPAARGGTGPAEGPRERSRRGGRNVGGTERILSAAAGVALVGAGLRTRTMRAALLPLGGGLLWRAVTGRCPVNRALGRNTAAQPASPVTSVGRGEGVRVERTITIDRTPAELFAFWRNVENLPRFMHHLESVTALDDRRSRWVAKAPAGRHVSWDAEIHNEIPNELIGWRSVGEADVDNAGSVHFRPASDGRGTEVRVVLRYDPPAGRLGATIAKLLGEDPARQIADDLQRLKDVMEHGAAAAAAEPSGSGALG